MRGKMGRFVGKGKEEFVCKYCNKKFLNYISNNRTFCSKKCVDFWKKIGYKGKNNHFYGKTHTERVRKIISEKQFKTPISQRLLNHCKLCGNIIKKSERTSWKDYKEKKFCSKNCSSKHYSGKNSNFWYGGMSYEPYDEKWTTNFKNKIRKRDNQVCMNCNKHREKLNRALNIHHINYNKKLTIPANCVSLCDKCHLLTRINREYWKKLFQEKLNKLYNYKYSESGEIILNITGGNNVNI